MSIVFCNFVNKIKKFNQKYFFIMKQEMYDEIKILIDNIIAIRIGYKWGLVDKDYNSLSKVVYDYISVEDNQIWIRYRGYKSYISTYQTPLKYDFIYDFQELPNEDKWAKIIVNNKYGAIDSKGSEIIPCKYDTIRDYRGALWVSEKQTDNTELYGVYSYRGEVISECAYVNLANPIVKKKVGEQIIFGILNEYSREVIPCGYASIVSTRMNNSRYNDETRNEIFILSKEKDGYEFLYSIKNGLITTAYNKIKQWDSKSYPKNYIREVKDIYYCYRGNHVDEYIYNPNSDNLLHELLNAYKPKYLDIYHFGNLLVTCNLDECTIESRVQNNLFICKSVTNGKYALLDGNGHRIPFIYDKMYVDDDLGVIMAMKDIIYSEIEETNTYLLNESPDKRVRKILEDASLDIYSKHGAIISQEISKKKFNGGYPYDSYRQAALAVIKKNKDSYYDSISSFSGYYCEYSNKKEVRIVSKNKKYGLLNYLDEIIIPLIYDDIQPYQRYFLIARNMNKVDFYTIDKYDIRANKLDYSFIGSYSHGKFIVSKTFTPKEFKNDEEYDSTELDIHCDTMGVIECDGNEIVPCKYSILDKEIMSQRVTNILDKLWEDYELQSCYYEGNSYIVRDRSNDTYGIIDIFGNKLSNFYELVEVFNPKWNSKSKHLPISSFNHDGIAVFQTPSGNGLINYKGEILLPSEYIILLAHNYEISFENDIWSNELGRRIGGVSKIQKNGLFGLLDSKYKIIVPCKYPEFLLRADFFNIGYLIIKDSKDQVGLGLIKIDNPNTYLIECIYNIDSLILHKDSTEKPTYITASTNTYSIVIDCVTDNLFQYEGYILEKIVDKYAVLRSLTNIYYLSSLLNNEIIHSFKYDAVGECDNQGYLQVRKNNKWGLYHLPSQQEVIQCCYYENYEMGYYRTLLYFKFDNKMAAIKMNHKYGFIDKSGATVIECKYDNVKPFENGYAAVYENYYWGFIDEIGNKIIDKLEECLGFSDGLAAIKMNGKWGYINTNGEIIIPCRFEKADSFSDGLASVAFKVRWGYIDKYNRTIIPFNYQCAFPFLEGIAAISAEDGNGHISKNGHVVDWKCYENDSYNDTDYARDTWDAMTDGMYGDYHGGDVDYDGLGF